MNCKKCGSPLTENDNFCKGCGTPVNEINSVPQEQNLNQNINTQNNNGMGTPVNNYPQYSQPVSNSQPISYEQPKGNGSFKYVAVCIIAAAIVVAMVIYVMSGKNNNELNNGTNDNTNNQTTNTENNNNSNNNVTSTSNTYKANYNGFTFSIPDDLIYEIDYDELLLTDESNTWLAEIAIGEGSFSQLQANKIYLQTQLQSSGGTFTPAVEKTYRGVNFITLEGSLSGTNAIFAFARANSMYYMVIVVYNISNTYDYSILEKVAPVISSANYNGYTTNIENKIKVNLDSISELAK